MCKPDYQCNTYSDTTYRISVKHSLCEVESIWDEVEQNGHLYVFQSKLWVQSWLESQSDSIKLCVVSVSDIEDRPLLILPLYMQQYWYGTVLHPAGGILADYIAPLLSKRYVRNYEPGEFRYIWEQIVAVLPDFDFVKLERLPETIESISNPILELNTSQHPSSAHSVEMFGPMDQFLKAKRSSRWLSGERRKEKKLNNIGDLEFVIANCDNRCELLAELIDQKTKSYQNLGAIDIFSDQRERAFIMSLTNKSGATELVLLCGLKVGNDIVATFWGVNFRRRLYYLLPAYKDGPLATYSPGNVLLRSLFQWALDNGIETFDFTVGDEPYKMLWNNSSMELFDYISGVTFSGKCIAFVLRVHRKIKKAAKSNETVSRIYLFLRSLSAKYVWIKMIK